MTGPLRPPVAVWKSDRKPRKDHAASAWLTATEFEDDVGVMSAKVGMLAQLMRLSRHTVVYDILREIKRETARAKNKDSVYVNANPDVADLMYGEELESVEALEAAIKKRIVVRALGHYHLERYEVYSR